MKASLTGDQKALLLDAARRALAHYLDHGTAGEIRLEDEALKAERGVFVTLKVDGQLRGCIGFSRPHRRLDLAVQEAAVSAASKDFRFPSLRSDELNRTVIEISVLSLPVRLEDTSRIVIGKHGVIVSKGMNTGLLLPQVPVEWGWDVKTYLQNACLKAGLPKDAWRDDVRIETFTAQVFSDAPS